MDNFPWICEMIETWHNDGTGSQYLRSLFEVSQPGAVRCAVGQSDCLVILFCFVSIWTFSNPQVQYLHCAKTSSTINLRISQCFLKKKTRQLCICTSHCTTPYEPEWLISSGFTVGWICKIVSSISSNRESPDGLGEDGRVCLCAPFPNFLGPTRGPLWTVRFRKVWNCLPTFSKQHWDEYVGKLRRLLRWRSKLWWIGRSRRGQLCQLGMHGSFCVHVKRWLRDVWSFFS